MENNREKLIEAFTNKEVMKKIIRKGIDHDQLDFFYIALEEAKKENLEHEHYGLFTNKELLNELLRIKDDIEHAFDGDEEKCYKSVRYNRLENTIVMLSKLPGPIAEEVFQTDEGIELISNIKEDRFILFAKEVDELASEAIVEGLKSHSVSEKVALFNEYGFSKDEPVKTK